tara:strand:- start:30514 stop:30693 length:180 start_codon:yes stop_codon:yes gene_type:complete
MKPTKTMVKWMLISLIILGIINSIGILIGLFIGSPLLTVVMIFNVVVIREGYNVVKTGR